MMDKTLIKSPLEEYSGQLKLINNNIQDFPEQGFFTFQPAGYTKPNINKVNRQHHLKNIYDTAVNIETENEEYPLQKIEHFGFKLKSEPTNKYDSNAVQVQWIVGPKLSYCIGYVPKVISRVITKNLNMIKNVRVYKVHSNIYEKYYQITLTVSYKEGIYIPATTKEISRFMDMLE